MPIAGAQILEIWAYYVHNPKYLCFQETEDQTVMPVGIWAKLALVRDFDIVFSEIDGLVVFSSC
jgi:hypothetical protein